MRRPPRPRPAAFPAHSLQPALAALAAAALAAGCLSYAPEETLPHKAFAVEGSGLDNVSFLYTPAEGDARFRWPCRLELYGTGLALLRTGPSPQVVDSFSQDTSNRSWNAFEEARLDLTPGEMRAVLQVFVDEGLVPSRSVRESGPDRPLLQAAGTIGRDKFVRTTRNHALVDAFEDFVETNFSGTLRRAGGRL